jgi:hypothetical protein
MLSRRIVAVRPLARTLPLAVNRPRFAQVQAANTKLKVTEVQELEVYDDITDPYMVSNVATGSNDVYELTRSEWWLHQPRHREARKPRSIWRLVG